MLERVLLRSLKLLPKTAKAGGRKTRRAGQGGLLETVTGGINDLLQQAGIGARLPTAAECFAQRKP